NLWPGSSEPHVQADDEGRILTVTTPSLTRTAFLTALLGAGTLAIAPNAFAARDTAAETYVQQNASQALQTLGNRGVSAAERRRLFDVLMRQFSDMDRIAMFVIGRERQPAPRDSPLRAACA